MARKSGLKRLFIFSASQAEDRNFPHNYLLHTFYFISNELSADRFFIDYYKIISVR